SPAAARGSLRPGLLRGRWPPALQLARRASKAVTRHWKAMHFQRQKLMAVTEYVAPRPPVTGPGRLRGRPPRPAADDGYARLLRRQVAEAFRDNRMIAVCQYSPLAAEDVALARHYLRRHNIEVKFFLNEVVRPVLSQSKYRNLLPLFVGRNVVLVSPEAKAKEMLRVLKSVPQISLLGACIDDTILSRKGVENFAKLPLLEASQGQTVGALALLPSRTSSLLQRGSLLLVALLHQHLKQLQAGAAAAPGSPRGSPETPAPSQSAQSP
uniref:Large ribosomal subunit protein uL10m n=1 Tax=Nothoprocta perdicaria TaxID=30464 RepID=A0A8C7EEA1_NOTPE